MVRLLVAAFAALFAAALVGGAGASVTGFDADGTVVLDGKKVFPIILGRRHPMDPTPSRRSRPPG
jgi:hypothetical protein